MENQTYNSSTERKRLPTWAIILITLAVVFIGLPVTCTACSVGCVGCAACAATVSETEDSEKNVDVDTVSTTDAVSSSKGNLGNYYIEIESARIGKDYDGNPTIFVTYNFTNNGSENASFLWSVSDIAFQDGVQLESAFVYSDDQYDSGASSLEIKPGATITLEQAYVLRNTTSPVDIEVTEFISLNDNKLEKTFNIE